MACTNQIKWTEFADRELNIKDEEGHSSIWTFKSYRSYAKTRDSLQNRSSKRKGKAETNNSFDRVSDKTSQSARNSSPSEVPDGSRIFLLAIRQSRRSPTELYFTVVLCTLCTSLSLSLKGSGRKAIQNPRDGTYAQTVDLAKIFPLNHVQHPDFFQSSKKYRVIRISRWQFASRHCNFFFSTPNSGPPHFPVSIFFFSDSKFSLEKKKTRPSQLFKYSPLPRTHAYLSLPLHPDKPQLSLLSDQSHLNPSLLPFLAFLLLDSTSYT